MYQIGSVRPRVMGLVLIASLLSGCEDGPDMSFLKPAEEPAETGQTSKSTGEARDVEAPDVFQVTEAGLWDGRPSLGGVWVAHPDVTDPQRVLIRNMSNGQSVIGALFRRERDIPGPRIQVSSDAAADLGMLAGAPVEISVTALIREELPTPVAEPAPEPAPQAEAATVAAASPDSTAAAPAEAAPAPAATAPVVEKSSPLSKPYVQIGIFSVEDNANIAAGQLVAAGLAPSVLEQSSNGRKFWRVLLGPAQTRGQRSAQLKGAKAAGFPDAYIVTN